MGKVIIPISLYAMPAAEWFPIGRAAATEIISGEIFIEICVAKEYFISTRWGDVLENELLQSIKKFKFDTPIDVKWKLNEHDAIKSLHDVKSPNLDFKIQNEVRMIENNKKDDRKFSLLLNDDKNILLPPNEVVTPLNSPALSLSAATHSPVTLPFGERMELCLKNSVLSLSGFAVYGRLYITVYLI